jgi:ArsR family transcriptional regulator
MGKKDLFSLEKLFGALADRTRLRLLNLMGRDEICVCFFVEALGLSQPKISRHLAYLRDAGLVEARREGKWMHYRVVSPPNEKASHLLNETLRCLQQDPEMQQDCARLLAACCSPTPPVPLQRAPRPASLARE